MFGATKLYPYFVDWMGFHGTFWMYGCVMVVEVIYGAISLPENKGQSLVKTEAKMTNIEQEEVNDDDEETKSFTGSKSKYLTVEKSLRGP